MLITSSAATDSQRWRSVEVRMRQLGHRPEGLIEVLHTVQETFGHLPVDALKQVAASLGVPLSTVYGVATFYAHFTLRPYGRHVCEVCTGTACHISGGEAVLAAVQDHLGTTVVRRQPTGGSPWSPSGARACAASRRSWCWTGWPSGGSPMGTRSLGWRRCERVQGGAGV